MKDQPSDNPADALEAACSRAIAQWRAWQLVEKAAARQPLKKAASSAKDRKPERGGPAGADKKGAQKKTRLTLNVQPGQIAS